MLISDYYNLIYTAEEVPQHVLKQVEGIRHKALAAYSVSSIKAAEWLLDNIEYQSKDMLRKQTRMGTISNNAAKAVGNYVKHIHAACKEIIQARFDKPVMTDEEAGELFFNEMLKDYLDRLAKGEDVSFGTFNEIKGRANSICRIDIERRIREQNLKRGESGLSLQKILTDKW